MKTFFWCACLLCVVIGCESKESGQLGQERQQTLAALKSVEYVRKGGAGGLNERIVVAADGGIEIEGRLIGTGKGKISEFQMMQLARAFEGWDKLNSTYAPAPNVPSSTSTQIKYGEKTVMVSDVAAETPEVFKRVRQRVESLVRDVPKGL